MEYWRTLLYPLGFLAALMFGARFLIQWIQSERAQKTAVPRAFWILSLTGNLLLMVHSFIQIQIHVCIVQACNAIISWRNLNLMQQNKPAASFRNVLILLALSTVAVCIAFAIQNYTLHLDESWFRIPTAPWQKNPLSDVPMIWHALGTCGYFLFSSRFWVQWWMAERCHASILPPAFWWLSLAGALLSILYFLQIQDSVNLIGPLVGIIPYIRNLMLMQKTKQTA